MPFPPDAIEDDAGESQSGIKMTEPIDQCRRTPGHTARIHHQDHRQPQPFCHLSAASRFGAAVVTVEEPHHSFDQPHIRPFQPPPEECLIILPVKHPTIEVTRFESRDLRMEAGIDEIGTHLERLHPQSPPLEGCHEGQGNGCLAASAVRPANEQTMFTEHLWPLQERRRSMISMRLLLSGFLVEGPSVSSTRSPPSPWACSQF